MRKAMAALSLLLAVLVFAASAAYLTRTAEHDTLDEAARAAAPGRFVGSSVGWTHYEVAGPDTGRVAVLVHGFSVPAYIWDSTFVALAGAGYRVIRYDLLGRGWSERADVPYTELTFEAQLGELLDSLRIAGPVDLFGLSFGGMVTTHFVAQHPERVRTLVLVDPVVRAPTMEGVQRMPLVGRYLFEVFAAPGMAEGQTGDFLHPEQFPGWADRYRPQMRYKGFVRALHRSRFEMTHVDFADLHQRIAGAGTPVLLVWGRQDRVVPIEQAEELRGRIPALEFFPVDSAGHLPHLEQSAAVHARILDFLARHPTPSAVTPSPRPPAP